MPQVSVEPKYRENSPGVSDTLEPELQAVVYHQMWVLGTKLRSFGKVVCTFNH